VFLFAFSLAACSKGTGAEKVKVRPPAPVMVAVAATRTVPVALDATGTVEAFSQVSVKSMVNGEVKKVHFTEGQDVAKGQILFTIDPRQYEASIRKGEADLARIKAQLATARANAERYGRLVKDGIVTAEQYDSFRTQSESLEADYAAQQANIETFRVQLSYCTIRSPISGRTGNLLIHAGNVVKANDTLSLVTINQIRPIYVTFSIPERELSRIRQYLGKRKMKVECRLPGDNGPPEIGEVSFLDNTVDAATATIKLKGTFANPKTRLWPGQFASVRLTLSSLADAVVVPTQAVQTGQQGQYVYVVTGDNAELRPVKAGITFEGITVVEQELKPGETVVVDGHMRVVPGGKVMVKRGADPEVVKSDKPAPAVTPVRNVNP
jgi:multidrug efflux system membrane fusion protein